MTPMTPYKPNDELDMELNPSKLDLTEQLRYWLCSPRWLTPRPRTNTNAS